MFSIVAPRANAFASNLKQTRLFFKAGIGVLVAGGILSLTNTTFDILSLTGSDLTAFKIWHFFTNFLMERNILVYFWAIWSLYQASIIDINWGSAEMVKYLALTQIVGSFVVTLIALIVFYFTRNLNFFYYTHINGPLPACAAIYVAQKQYLPDMILLTTILGRIKNTHLPACIVFISSILVLTGALRSIALLQIVVGIQISWTYLRFLQKHDDGEPRGDSSDHFAWATMFPSKLQPAMNTFSSLFYMCLVRLQICKPFTRHIDLTQLDSITFVLPNLQTKDTERRRQKALRDLTERLNRAQRIEEYAWPQMEDVDESTVVVETHPSVVNENAEPQQQISDTQPLSSSAESIAEKDFSPPVRTI